MNRTKDKLTPAQRNIVACRVCLGTTSKMYGIESCGLSFLFCIRYSLGLRQAFIDISGIQVFPGDGLPQHLCYICCSILRKAVQFRNKCHSTCSLLLSLPLTADLMTEINLLHGEPLIRTNVVYINVGDESNDTEVENNLYDREFENNSHFMESKFKLNDRVLKTDRNYEEFEIKSNNQEWENKLNDEEIENNLIDENIDNGFKSFAQNDADLSSDNDLNDYDEIDENDENIDDWLSCDQSDLNKIRRWTPVYEENDKNVINSYVFSYRPQYRVFYQYIDAKYIKNTWETDKLKNNHDLSREVSVTQNNKNITYNFDSKVNKIYDYMLKAYGYVDEDRDEAAKKIFGDSKSSTLLIKKGRTRYHEKLSWTRSMEFAKEYNFEVRYLSKEEQINVLKERMETDRYKEAKFKCEDCYMGFSYEFKYKKHRMLHDPVFRGDIMCDVCKLRFRDKKCYRRHMDGCHKFDYVCKECGKRYRVRVNCREHYKQHKGGATLQCPYCPLVFRKHWGYRDHIRIRHGTVRCDICYKLLVPNGVTQHKLTQHLETFKCQNCDNVFHDAAALSKHLQTSPNEVCSKDYWPCTKCGENFNTEDDRNVHIKAKCGRPGYWKSPKQKSGPTQRSDESGGVVRRRVKGGGSSSGPVMCESCGYTCQSMATLSDHMRIHTGERPFQCASCPKRFRLKMSLQIHLKTHTGERPYRCKLCPKTFTNMWNFRRHEKDVHMGARPFQCHICEKTFAQKNSVESHIKYVHMKIPAPPRKRKRKNGQKNSEKFERSVVEKVYGKRRREKEPEEDMNTILEELGRGEVVVDELEESINTSHEEFEEDIGDCNVEERTEEDEDVEDELEESINTSHEEFEEDRVESNVEERTEDDEDVEGRIEVYDDETEYLEDWHELDEEVGSC